MSRSQPKLCPDATWNANGTTLVGNSTVGINPQTLFVDSNNTVYVSNYENGTVYMWSEGGTSPTVAIVTNYTRSNALFVSTVKDIYINTGSSCCKVDVWRENANSSFASLSIVTHCYGLFMVTNDSLYCSMRDSHQVINRSINSNNYQLTGVAGTGCAGHLPNMLQSPHGIFVTINFDLYVADTGNQRVQLFRAGQLNGITMAGIQTSGTVQLYNPMAVILDVDEYLFILDSGNHRIVGSGPNGFRCLIGCARIPGSAPDQLSGPLGMAFDRYGNIWVTDTGNGRIQKFDLSSNTCSK